MVTQLPSSDSAVSVAVLCDYLCRVLPSLERRVNLYLDFKLFCEPPLHCSPQWESENRKVVQRGIANGEAVVLVNAMISPNRRDKIAFKLYDAEQCDFDFRRLCKGQ